MQKDVTRLCDPSLTCMSVWIVAYNVVSLAVLITSLRPNCTLGCAINNPTVVIAVEIITSSEAHSRWRHYGLLEMLS